MTGEQANPRRHHRSHIALVAACTTLLTSAAPADQGRAADHWRITGDAGYVQQFKDALDSGGDFDLSRYFLRLSASRRFDARWSGGLSASYGENRYGFSGKSGFGGSAPWGDIRQFRVSLPLRFQSAGPWSMIAIPTLRYSAENGAGGDSRQWGLLGAAAYRFSDRLSIGPGFGVFSGLEQSTELFPILFVDWKIADQWRLETGKGLGASRGPGVSLKWRPARDWSFGLGARYEKTRFRLDKHGPTPNGVGEDKSFPVSLSATYSPSPEIRLSVLGGIEFAGSLSLEDSDGNRLDSSDYDSAPFVGLLANLRF